MKNKLTNAKKRTTILSAILALFMVLAVNLSPVKAQTTGQEIVNYAQNFLGVPYVWGGTTPSGFDCSGLVQYVYAHFGISLPRTSQDQQNIGTPVSRANLQPGDLVFFGSPAYHVGIYVGNGSYINAPKTGDVVKIASVDRSDFSGGRRIIISNSYVNIDGGGTNVNGNPGINLIIRSYSSDIERVYAWVDSDTGASWSFAKQVPNSNYIQLSQNASKVIYIRNGGSSFTANANYKITVKGYNKNGEVVAQNQIVLKAGR